jgi:hypothetical protein
MSSAANLICWLWLTGPLSPGEPALLTLPSAIASVAETDADFAFQGEYLGTASKPGFGGRYGLQVATLGQGKFEAKLYEGGLPGSGASGQTAFLLQGERTGGSGLNLAGSGWTIKLADGKSAQVGLESGTPDIALLTKTDRSSSTLGAKPPANATILFDGSAPTLLKDAQVKDGLLQVGTETTRNYRDFTLHAEFRTPYMPEARGQARANSGFYLQRRYEVQVLDSFGQWPQYNEAGSIYKTKPPDVNMSYPPLAWQTYDIDFTAPRFDACGNKLSHGVLTVKHNGVTIHNQVTLYNKTGGGKQEGPEPQPILLQNHGNPVEFRNVWLVEK